jgi:hypothetical protein
LYISYKVQESLLIDISSFFDKALEAERFEEGRTAVLRFPDDNASGWKVLLYWVMRGQVPSGDEFKGDEAMALVHAWILGDKYDIEDFQDYVMMELLCWLQHRSYLPEMVKTAFENTPRESKLRKLMAEEVAYSIRACDAPFWSLDIFDGVEGFIGEFAAALIRHGEKGMAGLKEGVVRSRWNDYMVGDGPSRHWVYKNQWGWGNMGC